MYALLLARKDGTLGPQLVRSTIDCEQWIAEHRAIWERHFDRLSDVLDDAFPTDQGDRR